MSTYKKITREVLRRKVGNRALSKVYKKFNAKPIKHKQSKLKRRLGKCQAKSKRFLESVITCLKQI